MGRAAPNGTGHALGDLPHQGIAEHNPHGAQDQVRPGGVHHHGILPRGALVGPGAQHGRGGQGIGTHRQQRLGGAKLLELLYQRFAHAAPLSIHNQDAHASSRAAFASRYAPVTPLFTPRPGATM